MHHVRTQLGACYCVIGREIAEGGIEIAKGDVEINRTPLASPDRNAVPLLSELAATDRKCGGASMDADDTKLQLNGSNAVTPSRVPLPTSPCAPPKHRCAASGGEAFRESRMAKLFSRGQGRKLCFLSASAAEPSASASCAAAGDDWNDEGEVPPLLALSEGMEPEPTLTADPREHRSSHSR